MITKRNGRATYVAGSEKMLTAIPAGLRQIYATFGDPRAANFTASQLVPFVFPYPMFYEGKPVKYALCHRLAAENFLAAFRAVEAAGFANRFSEYSGLYNLRSIRGMADHLSAHSWGIAIDMEASKYPLGSSKRLPAEIVKAFTDYGFEYGGDFVHRPDPMHFQLCTNY